MNLIDDGRCFACGMENPHGLRIAWHVEGMTMSGRFTPDQRYQGWVGILHGGITATLLDEAMARLAGVLFGTAVTAEMTVRYVAPAVIGEELLIQGDVAKDSRKLIEMNASIHSSSGALIARATGKVIRLIKRA